MLTTQAKCKIIALLIILVVINHWRVMTNITLPSHIGWLNYVSTLSILFFVLNIVAAIGLFTFKRWSFFVSYLAIAFSTFFFATPYIPVITHFIPHNFRYIGMTIINLLIMLWIFSLHRKAGRKK